MNCLPVLGSKAETRGRLIGNAIALTGPCGIQPKAGKPCWVPETVARNVDLLIVPLAPIGETIPLQTNMEGYFEAELAPGNYELRLARAKSPWLFAPLNFSIQPDRLTHITIRLQLLRG